MYSTFQLARKYLHYYVTAASGKGHGIHSPFVFSFIKNILNDKRPDPAHERFELIRKRLLKDNRMIEVEDFGAGSSVIKSNQRKISSMAASSLKPAKFAKLLHRMVAAYQPANMVELGTSFGITSAYMASGNPAGKLFTFEGAHSIAEIARGHFQELGIENIELTEADFNHTLPVFLKSNRLIEFVFIDGNHRKLPTLSYFNSLLEKALPACIFVFDDIHWSSEMEEAWKEIQQHERVTLSIDLFFIGIVFINPDFKEKQHFKIRF